MNFVLIQLLTFLNLIKNNYVSSQATSIANQFLPEDGRLNFIELSHKYGYHAEDYNVTTEDGYIIRIFRIPGKKEGQPLLLLHGIFDSCDSWILRGNASFAVYYSALGYDLWFPNVRGNRYSRQHVRLDPDTDREFWDYSVNEHGYHDLAVSIDLVLNKTGAKSLSAIGHSQGNTMFYVLTSTRPEYNSKIDLLIALAPIYSLQNLKQPLSTIMKVSPFIYRMLLALGLTELFGDASVTNALIKLFCSQPIIGYIVCFEGSLFPVAGRDSEQLDSSFSRVVLGHFPTGTSMKNLYHYAQIGLRKQFSKFDYGIRKNILVYGSVKPPIYEMKNVNISVALFTAKNDVVSTIPDVNILNKNLPNVVKYVIIENNDYNHVDYLWARNNNKLLFPYINEILKVKS